MRKCCCCIPILAGATILGLIALVFCALEYVVTIPYLADLDESTFNPLKANIEYLKHHIEGAVKQFTNDTEVIQGIMIDVEKYTWTSILSEAISTGIYFIVSLLMICGIHCDIRGLMIPYLVLQMLYIILATIMGAGATVVFFYYNTIMGIVSAAVVLILVFLFIYFWVAVQKVSSAYLVL